MKERPASTDALHELEKQVSKGRQRVLHSVRVDEAQWASLSDASRVEYLRVKEHLFDELKQAQTQALAMLHEEAKQLEELTTTHEAYVHENSESTHTLEDELAKIKLELESNTYDLRQIRTQRETRLAASARGEALTSNTTGETETTSSQPLVEPLQVLDPSPRLIPRDAQGPYDPAPISPPAAVNNADDEDSDSQPDQSGVSGKSSPLTPEPKPSIRLHGDGIYTCRHCGTHLGLECDVESKSYQVGQGSFEERKRGYLFSMFVNLSYGPVQDEEFRRGTYGISWVSCSRCDSALGWKYVRCARGVQGADRRLGKYCISRQQIHTPQERALQQRASAD